MLGSLSCRRRLFRVRIPLRHVLPPWVLRNTDNDLAELHDYMGEMGRKVGMPLDQFVNEALDGFQAGLDQIIVGSIGPSEAFHEIVDKRVEIFEQLAQMMRQKH